MDANLNDDIKHFFKSFDHLRTHNNDLVSMHGCFKLPALNILFRTLSSVRLQDDDEKVQYFIQRVERLLDSIPFGTHPMFAFPFLTKIPGLTPHQDYMENVVMIRDYFAVSATKSEQFL